MGIVSGLGQRIKEGKIAQEKNFCVGFSGKSGFNRKKQVKMVPVPGRNS